MFAHRNYFINIGCRLRDRYDYEELKLCLRTTARADADDPFSEACSSDAYLNGGKTTLRPRTRSCHDSARPVRHRMYYLNANIEEVWYRRSYSDWSVEHCDEDLSTECTRPPGGFSKAGSVGKLNKNLLINVGKLRKLLESLRS